MNEKWRQLKEWTDGSDNIVLLGGTEVSTENGISDFRNTSGLYNQRYKYPPETIISHSSYMWYLGELYRFYRDRTLFTGALSNGAHRALVRLEEKGELRAVTTQNIDDLHQMARGREVLELHGSVHKNYCTRCGQFYDLDHIVKSDGVPHCSCGGVIKPNVALCEEGPDNKTLQRSVDYIRNIDILITGGTSLAVYSAAGLTSCYRDNKLVLINKVTTSRDSQTDLVVSNPAGEVLGTMVN